jgi:hypothetical protein
LSAQRWSRGQDVVVPHTFAPLRELLFSLQTHFQQTASFAATLFRTSKQAAISAITLFHPLNRQLFLISRRF